MEPMEPHSFATLNIIRIHEDSVGGADLLGALSVKNTKSATATSGLIKAELTMV